MEGAKFEATMMRIASITKSIKPKDLAKILDVSPAAVSKALTKKHIPQTWYNTLAAKYNLSHEWLIYGDVANQGAGIQEQPVADTAASARCSQCFELYKKLEKTNDRLHQANEQVIALLKENGDLREKVGKLENEVEQLKNALSAYEDDVPMSNAS